MFLLITFQKICTTFAKAGWHSQKRAGIRESGLYKGERVIASNIKMPLASAPPATHPHVRGLISFHLFIVSPDRFILVIGWKLNYPSGLPDGLNAVAGGVLALDMIGEMAIPSELYLHSHLDLLSALPEGIPEAVKDR